MAAPVTTGEAPAAQPSGYVMQAQPVQYAPAGTNGASTAVGIANAGYVMAPTTNPSGGNAVMMQPRAQQVIVPAQGGEGQTGAAPQVIYVMAQPQQQQVTATQPTTFDDYVIENMKTTKVCFTFEGLNLDIPILCSSIHQIGCSAVLLYLSLVLCFFVAGVSTLFFCLTCFCCISWWTSMIASIGNIVSMCCKCNGKSHRTGCVSLFVCGSLMAMIAVLLFLTIYSWFWRIFISSWIFFIVVVTFPIEIYFAYEWLQVVTKSQVQMGQSPNYCDFC